MMRYLEKTVAAGLTLVLGAALAGCQAVDTALTSAEQVIGAVNTVLGVPPQPGVSASASSVVRVDDTARQSVAAALKKAAPGAAAGLFREAKPALEQMITAAACTREGRRMSRFEVPEGGIGYINPFWHLQYHQSGCLAVLRINNIKKQSANAFSFYVSYVSPQSQETSQVAYTAVKQPDGEWLFKWKFAV